MFRSAQLDAALRKLMRLVFPRAQTHGDRLRAALFDSSYYLFANPDVAKAGVDPLRHYVTHGWHEGRRPNAVFDPVEYLAVNPDVYQSGMEPLLHYAVFGADEGRRVALFPHQRDSASYAARSLRAHIIEDTKASSSYVLSFSHHDYHLQVGGVENVVGDEERAFCSAGWNYLHISPAAPAAQLVDPLPASDFRVKLRLNGKMLGNMTIADLLSAVAELRDRCVAMECVIHHFAGHVPELILAVFKTSGAKRPIVWLHDFFMLCKSYVLLRNDETFCSAPPESSEACRTCCYSAGRSAHRVRIRAFFEETQPFILSPSEAGLEIFRRFSDMPILEAEVVSLARLAAGQTSIVDRDESNKRALRIAFVGAQASHKGWKVFKTLALRFGQDPRYRFFHFGGSNDASLPDCIRNISVRVTPEHREAMIEALVKERIDVVIIWPLWPETFCFTVHEALAAGAFVVAPSESGHVWPAVATCAPNQGFAAADTGALFAFFEGDDLHTRFTAARRRCHALQLSAGTADWLLAEKH